MILAGVTVSTLLWANWASPYVWIVLGVTLTYGAIGCYDDYLKVTKQIDQGVSAAMPACSWSSRSRLWQPMPSCASAGRDSPMR